MKLIICLILTYGYSCYRCHPGIAQNKSIADTLRMLTSYMKEVEAALPQKSRDSVAKMNLMQQVISKGTAHKYLLQRQLARISVDSMTTQQLIKQYNCLLQSLVLLQSSLKQLPFQDDAVQEELRYLHRHLLPFIHSLYFYSRCAERRAEQ